MNKEKLRFLALGFFLSAVILTGFQLSDGSSVSAEKQANAELESIPPVKIATPESESTAESEQAEFASAAETEESSQIEDEVESELDVDEAFVFYVHEGQPSSVVVENLHTAGLIEDLEVAQTYLKEYDLANRIQFGSYELSSDMTYQEIFAIITIQ